MIEIDKGLYNSLRNIGEMNKQKLSEYIDITYINEADTWDNLFKPVVTLLEEPDHTYYHTVQVQRIEHIVKYDNMLYIFGTDECIKLDDEGLPERNEEGRLIGTWDKAYNLLNHNIVGANGDYYVYTSGKHKYGDI